MKQYYFLMGREVLQLIICVANTFFFGRPKVSELAMDQYLFSLPTRKSPDCPSAKWLIENEFCLTGTIGNYLDRLLARIDTILPLLKDRIPRARRRQKNDAPFFFSAVFAIDCAYDSISSTSAQCRKAEST